MSNPMETFIIIALIVTAAVMIALALAGILSVFGLFHPFGSGVFGIGPLDDLWVCIPQWTACP